MIYFIRLYLFVVRNASLFMIKEDKVHFSVSRGSAHRVAHQAKLLDMVPIL